MSIAASGVTARRVAKAFDAVADSVANGYLLGRAVYDTLNTNLTYSTLEEETRNVDMLDRLVLSFDLSDVMTAAEGPLGEILWDTGDEYADNTPIRGLNRDERRALYVSAHVGGIAVAIAEHELFNSPPASSLTNDEDDVLVPKPVARLTAVLNEFWEVYARGREAGSSQAVAADAAIRELLPGDEAAKVLSFLAGLMDEHYGLPPERSGQALFDGLLAQGETTWQQMRSVPGWLNLGRGQG
jgi:hypothetical protein